MHGAELVPNRIFVAGLPQNTDQAELLEYFAHISGSAANITEINIVNEKSGLSKGYGFVTFVSESEARRVLDMDSESFVFKETKLIVSSAYMRPKYNIHFKGHQATNYKQSSQYFFNSKNAVSSNQSYSGASEKKSECISIDSSSFTSPTPLTCSTHTCNTLDIQEAQGVVNAELDQPTGDATIQLTSLSSSSSSSSSATSSTSTSSLSLNVNRINTNGLESKPEWTHDSNNNNPSESNLNKTLNCEQPKAVERAGTGDSNMARRARNEDSSGSSAAAEFNQQPTQNFNHQFSRFNLSNKKNSTRQFEQQLHIQTNPVNLPNKNPSLTAAAAAIATASSNSGTLSPKSNKHQPFPSHTNQFHQYQSNSSFLRVGTSPSSFTKVKQKSANLDKMPNTSNLVGSVGSIVNKASINAFNKVPNDYQIMQNHSSSENGTAHGPNENKQTTNPAYTMAATYANRSASINSSTLQAQHNKPDAKQTQVVSTQRQRSTKANHSSPPHSFDYSLYKHQQHQQQTQMVQMPASVYPTAHAFYTATAMQYDSSNMANQQPKQYIHSGSKQSISNNATTISNAFETVVSSGQQINEPVNEVTHNYYVYNQIGTNKAVEEMDEAMKSKLNLTNTVKNTDHDHTQIQIQPQQQQIPTVYYYCPTSSTTGQDLALIQSQPQQQQSLNANACYYYYTPISPAIPSATLGHQVSQQQPQQQPQQFNQSQSKQPVQTSQPINYLTHYGFVDPYSASGNIPVVQPQAYYGANVSFAQYPHPGYYLNSQQFMSMGLNQGSGTIGPNGLAQTSYQPYTYVQPQSQSQQSSHHMKPVVNTHVQQQQRPPSAPHIYYNYQSRSNTPNPALYADQYMVDPNSYGMVMPSPLNTTNMSNGNRGSKMKYSHSNRVPTNRTINNHYQQGNYAKTNRTYDMTNKFISAFVPPPTNQNMMSTQQHQQQQEDGQTEQITTN